MRTNIIKDLGNNFPSISSQVRNLGVIIDSKKLVWLLGTVFINYRLFTNLKSSLSFQDLEKVVHAFITSRLDYCNSLYSGLPHSSLSCFQLEQNAAERLLTGAKKYDHVTPNLASIHGLPVQFRVQFKILLFVFKALNNQAPSYLKDFLIPLSSTRHLRSTDRLFYLSLGPV